MDNNHNIIDRRFMFCFVFFNLRNGSSWSTTQRIGITAHAQSLHKRTVVTTTKSPKSYLACCHYAEEIISRSVFGPQFWGVIGKTVQDGTVRLRYRWCICWRVCSSISEYVCSIRRTREIVLYIKKKIIGKFTPSKWCH